jgi:hypothetical protein
LNLVGKCLRVGQRSFDYQIAIHEAGHVIAGYMLLSVAGSTIEFVDGHHGLTWSNDAALEPGTDTVESICAALVPLMPGVLDTELEQAHSHVIEFLAGITAEELFCSEPPLANTAHDILAARSVAALIVRPSLAIITSDTQNTAARESDIDRYIDLARDETLALLLTHTASVLAVAGALVEHRTIDGEQIDSIIGSAFSFARINRLHSPSGIHPQSNP